jgi:hypothetical protein
MHSLNRGKRDPEICATSVVFKKLPKERRNSPNLVTLFTIEESADLYVRHVPFQFFNVPWKAFIIMPWRRGLVVSSPPATKETGAMGLEIESRVYIGW